MKEEAHLPFYTTSLSFFFLFSPFLLSLSLLSKLNSLLHSKPIPLSLSLFFLVPYIQPGIGFWQFRASFGFWLQILVSAALVSCPLSFCLGGSEFEFKTKTQQDNFSETMIGNFIDEIDCGSFFDTIDDLLDFPNDDVESGLGSAPDCNAAFNNNSLWPNQSGSLPAPNDAVFSAGNSASDLSAELSVPIEDIVQLEWLSNFVEDSFSGGSLTINKPDSFINKNTSHHQFQTSSPISVLDSSSSCSGDKNVPQSPGPVAAPGKRGRARSKRPRPATFNPRPAIQLISPASSVTEAEGPQAQPFLAPKVPSDSENFAESRPVIKIPKQASGELKKKKKLKVSLPLAPLEGNQNSGPTQAAVRKCLHCEITKTPQWRAGPMGPKTLCNACGVRYKSGRLFPEYRPAASPTFVPSLHSNSHKKVLEMRTKGGELVVFGETATAMNETPELIPNTNSSISMDYM